MAHETEAELRAEIAALRQRLDEARDRGADWAGKLGGALGREVLLEEALRRFVRIAAEVRETARERRSRGVLALRAAALARQGKHEEARAAMARIDRAPIAWEFSRTIDDLAEAEEAARALLPPPATETEGT